MLHHKSVAEKLGLQPRVRGLFFCALLSVPLLAVSSRTAAADGATLKEVSGSVLVRTKGTELWNQVSRGYLIGPGDAVKTRRRSQTTVDFEDGSKVEVAAKSFFVLEEAKADKKSMNFTFGRMKAWVDKTLSQRFTVRTPTAVCSVRGTHFGIDVAQNGQTSVSLFTGLLGVADSKGNEIMLKPGQRIDVDKQGIGKLSDAKAGDKKVDEKLRDAIKKEVGLEMTKEDIQAAAALEMKSAVYKDGKALVDVNGNRVRVESYIIRPTHNQFKLVILNSRVDRFDYFYYKGTFNTSLPTELSEAFRQVNGCIGAACRWYLTERERAFSNTIDNHRIIEWGGHLVDLNNNKQADNVTAFTADDVKSAVDYRTGEFVSIAPGTPFFKTLFDYGAVSYTGAIHSGWAPDAAAGVVPWNGTTGGIQNLTSYDANQDPNSLKGPNGDVDNTPAALPGTPLASINALTTTIPIRPPNCTAADKCTGFRDPEKYYQVIYAQNGNGDVWDRTEIYIINDQGDIMGQSAFPSSDNALFKKALLEVNYQQIITASDFKGRKIDLVATPRILIDSGLIP